MAMLLGWYRDHYAEISDSHGNVSCPADFEVRIFPRIHAVLPDFTLFSARSTLANYRT